MLLGSVLLASGLAVAEEYEHREHSAHEHGAAQLTIAVDRQSLEMNFNAPAANIVGFEHAPGNQEQRDAVKQAVAQLEQWQQLFDLPVAAECRLIAVNVASELLTDHDHAHDHDDHKHDNGHADFTVSYSFDCQSPAALDAIGINLFEVFPGNEHIEVQYIMPSGQGMRELSAEQNRIEF